MFSNGSSSSISLAMVTPSLVIVGAPNFLSSTTLRPLGPSVIFTASASASTPFLRARRASSSNSSCLAMSFPLPVGRSNQPGAGRCLLDLDLGQDVLLGQDQVVDLVQLDVVAGVLGVDDAVADADLERHALAVVVQPAGANRHNLTLLRLLLCRIRDHQTAGERLFCLHVLDHDAVGERDDLGCHVPEPPALPVALCRLSLGSLAL